MPIIKTYLFFSFKCSGAFNCPNKIVERGCNNSDKMVYLKTVYEITFKALNRLSAKVERL